MNDWGCFSIWLLQNKILLPGVTTLTRLISEILEKSADRLWSRLSGLASGEQCSLLEELLQVPDGVRTSRFDQLRKGPVAISGPAFNQAVSRYLKLKAFGIQGLDFTGIPPRPVCGYYLSVQNSPYAARKTNSDAGCLCPFLRNIGSG